MRFFFIGLCFVFVNGLFSQITCDALRNTNVNYNCNSIKSGKARLYNADTAITNKIQIKTFELKKYSELSETEKTEVRSFKINLNESDTVLIYDWDMLQNGKMAYHGKAIGKVNINCRDSVMHIYKYILSKETEHYTPTRFKIIRMHEKDFIINDMNHPYLNVNYYFKTP